MEMDFKNPVPLYALAVRSRSDSALSLGIEWRFGSCWLLHAAENDRPGGLSQRPVLSIASTVEEQVPVRAALGFEAANARRDAASQDQLCSTLIQSRTNVGGDHFSLPPGRSMPTESTVSTHGIDK
jgi:hypothetical protein